MNGYVCFWRQQRIEVRASTSYEAQQKAVSEFQKRAGRRKVHRYDIAVVLAETQETQP
ncbi:MAG: hypothetical protein ACOY3P_20305 [Planctomycetota bacterium]